MQRLAMRPTSGRISGLPARRTRPVWPWPRTSPTAIAMCCYCKQSGCAAATVRAFPLPGTWNRAECATQAGWRVTGDAGCRRRRRAGAHQRPGGVRVRACAPRQALRRVRAGAHDALPAGAADARARRDGARARVLAHRRPRVRGQRDRVHAARRRRRARRLVRLRGAGRRARDHRPPHEGRVRSRPSPTAPAKKNRGSVRGLARVAGRICRGCGGAAWA